MKPVLILLNISIEGPGYISEFLQENGIPYEVVDLYQEDQLPEEPEDYGAVVVMGGPMNAYEDDVFPYLKPEKELIRRCIEKRVPFLGVCLGGQLLAVAAGSDVVVNEAREIGWLDVHLTEEGQGNPLFEGLPSSFPVFQWHHDMFEIPLGCPRLAESRACRNQAFSVEDLMYGLQFHLETSHEDIVKWGREYLPQIKDEEIKEKVEALMESEDREREERVREMAWRLSENFFGKIAGYSL